MNVEDGDSGNFSTESRTRDWLLLNQKCRKVCTSCGNGTEISGSRAENKNDMLETDSDDGQTKSDKSGKVNENIDFDKVKQMCSSKKEIQ